MEVVFKFYESLRQAGVMNMWEAAPYAWAGPNQLSSRLEEDGYNPEDFQELLQMAEASQAAIVHLAYTEMEHEGFQEDEYVNDELGEESAEANEVNRRLRIIEKRLYGEWYEAKTKQIKKM